MKTYLKTGLLILAVALGRQAAGQSYLRPAISTDHGFERQKVAYCTGCITDTIRFGSHVVIHADSLGAYRDTIACVRNSVPFPDSTTLMQKVIPLKDTAYYMPAMAGEIGGFVAAAADDLATAVQVYHGLSLNYANTLFAPQIGYAVVRFKIPAAKLSELKIPAHTIIGYANAEPDSSSYPYRATGFTYGGIPEYKLIARIPPQNGAEMYKVDVYGNETRLSTYDAVSGTWK